MKPTKLPTLHKPWVKTTLYWTLLYAIALVVILLDCIVWRP